MATLLNDRDKALQAAAYRSKISAVTITSTTGLIKTAKNGGATTPGSFTLTATPNVVFTAAATYTWHYALSATPNTWVALGTGITQTITNTAFLTALGTSNQIQYRCTVTEPYLDNAYGFFTVLYSLEPSEPIIVGISRDNAVIACSTDGTPISYSNTDATISVFRGTTALAYSSTPNVPNTFSVAIQADDTARTVGTVTTTTNTYSISGITAITINIATVIFVVTVYDASGVAVSPTIAKKITYTKVINGAKGDTGTTGATGAAGNKFATIYAYAWSNAGSAPSHSQAFTYTWGTGSIDAYPSGYTYAAPISPGSGYVLYQLSLSITGAGTDVNTSGNWSNAVVNSIGYRLDGSIGPQGNSARTCYIVTSSGTPPSTPTAAVGDQPPSGWSFNATSTLSEGQYMYQSDGILGTSGNIAWGSPYLSNLKVANLSAISANLGTINAGSMQIGDLGNNISRFTVGTDGNVSIRNATSGPRMEINNNSIRIYDGTVLRVQLGDLTVV